jgi:uncharacterized protein YbaP (TraB family)
MKKCLSVILAGMIALSAAGQGSGENTLLWKITGKGLDKPSYLFGTIHMICREDAVISPNLSRAIRNCDDVYFEVDMDNLFETLMAVRKMRMRGDTTLKDLLSDTDYRKVKDYFETRESVLPFDVLETYKPFLTVSTLEQGSLPCEKTAMMEQVVMEEAKKHEKTIKGLETLSHQAGVLDSIPYKLQAEQLLAYVEKASSGKEGNEEIEKMFRAYKSQDLAKLEEMLHETDAGIAGFAEILLYNRNINWVNKLKGLMGERSLVIAVGAGHLPGNKGMINLLRREGYKVTPIENKISVTREL